MKRVGILVGREKTFPEAIIKGINEQGRGDVAAEYIKLDGVRFDDPPKYDLVIDRISHEVPFYRATLKRMALEGTIIINNPFWWSADDKFFNYSLGKKLGVAIPKTVLLYSVQSSSSELIFETFFQPPPSKGFMNAGKPT